MTSPPEIVPKSLQDLISRNNNITIERCAKVAEEYIGIGAERDNIMARTIAAAIRKLKDQPDPNLKEQQ